MRQAARYPIAVGRPFKWRRQVAPAAAANERVEPRAKDPLACTTDQRAHMAVKSLQHAVMKGESCWGNGTGGSGSGGSSKSPGPL